MKKRYHYWVKAGSEKLLEKVRSVLFKKKKDQIWISIEEWESDIT